VSIANVVVGIESGYLARQVTPVKGLTRRLEARGAALVPGTRFGCD